MEGRISRRTLMLPMRYGQIYLWLTLLIFIASETAARIDNLISVVFFAAASFLLFYAGYRLAVRKAVGGLIHPVILSPREVAIGRVVIVIGATYFSIWAVNQIYDFGGRYPGDVVRAILDPGQAYKMKFDVYERRDTYGEVNKITQLLISLSLFSAIFIQSLVFFWRDISWRLKVYAVASVVLYVASFLFIGTQKGVGDVFLYLVAGLAVLLASGRLGLSKRNVRRVYALALVFLLFSFGYMVINQISRADAFGLDGAFIIEGAYMFGDTSSSVLADIFGDKFAYGFYTTIGYPSHGYAGLSYNLQQDFAFAKGAGISPALEAYRLQYVGGESNFQLTYPARTEIASGWPAGMYWATVFPWLASDLTFTGAALLMFLVGYAWARAWIACLSGYDILSVALFGQLIIFVAFIPANNQVLMSRQGLWIVFSVLGLWLGKRLVRRKV